MEYFVVCLVALLGSALTFFSGFGLGTLLLPVFAIFFSVEMAVALTAIVHFLNNIFKLSLVGKKADKNVVLQFGIPAIASSFAGAYLLLSLTEMQPLYQYRAGGALFSVTPVKLTIAVLLAGFAVLELVPKFSKLSFSKKYLPLGGVLSGFFGGVSGNQGALRSAFLIRAGLSKEAFIATGVVIAVLVDIARLTVYARKIFSQAAAFNYYLVTAATFSAFAGAWLGNKLLKKVTIRTLQILVGTMLLIFAVLLGAGII
jgi:uncharacterized membrane protein YfcA